MTQIKPETDLVPKWLPIITLSLSSTHLCFVCAETILINFQLYEVISERIFEIALLILKEVLKTWHLKINVLEWLRKFKKH